MPAGTILGKTFSLVSRTRRRPLRQTISTFLLVGLMILAAGFGLVGMAVADDWPQFGHDANHSGANDGRSDLSVSSAPSLTLRWSFPTGGPIVDAPAVVGGTVYFGSWDGYLYAVNSQNGALEWKTFVGQIHAPACDPSVAGVSSGPAVANGVVYVGGGDGYFYALDAATGATKWRILVGDETDGNYLWSSPSLLGNGLAFLGVASFGDCPLVPGKVLEIDTNQQQVVATASLTSPGETGAGVWTSAASLPSGGTVFVTDGNSEDESSALAPNILALSWNGLRVIDSWQIPESQWVADPDWSTSPVPFTTSSGQWRVGAANKNGLFYAFDATNLGQGPVWETAVATGGPDPELGQGTISSAAFDDGRLYVAGGTSTIGSASFPGSIRALDPDDGSSIWQVGLSAGPVMGSVATANGLVVDEPGPDVEVRDANEGNLLFQFGTNGQIEGAPAIGGSWIYAGSSDGSLYAFSLPSSLLPADVCPTSVPTPFPPTPTPGPSVLGSSVVGTTLDTSGRENMRGSSVTASSTAPVAAIELFLSALDPSNSEVSFAIYTDAGGHPGSLVWSSGNVTPSGTGWTTVPVSGVTFQANQTYWLLFNTEGQQTETTWSVAPTTAGWSAHQAWGAGWSETAPDGDNLGQSYSIAAILAPGSSQTSVPPLSAVASSAVVKAPLPSAAKAASVPNQPNEQTLYLPLVNNSPPCQ